MGQWQVNFPRLPDVQVVNVGRQDEGSSEEEFDFSAIIESVHRQHEDKERIEQIYQEQMVPLHIFGERAEKTAFDAILHLAMAPNVGVRCCRGSAAEREQGERYLGACNALVLDLSGIATLFLLEMVPRLEHFEADLVVSQGTVNSLREMVVNQGLLRGGAGKSGVLVKAGRDIALVENAPEEINEYISGLRGLISALQQHCRVESSEKLAEMEPGKREKLVEFFGQYGAEAMVLAAAPGRVLWTDDLVQAEIARSELGASRVWTQLVLQNSADIGETEQETFFDATAKLTGFGYSFTSQSPETIMRAGILAEWKVNRAPFSQALATFGEASVELMQIIRLAAGFLRLVYMEPILPVTRASVTVGVLEGVVRKEGGMEGIHLLQRLLPSLFGVNVVGLAEAAEIIGSWVRRVEDRSLRL